MRVFVETERLLLRRFTEADVDRLSALHNDPEVMRFINGGKPATREEIEHEYREHFARHGYWAVVEKATGEFMGWFALHPTEGGDSEGYELGYRLKRSAWGKGYATEGSRALIRKGFVELGVRRVWAQTMAVNLPSRRVMEKAGLAYVRTFHLEWEDPLPGTEHGEVEYALTREDWGRREAQEGVGSPPGCGRGSGGRTGALVEEDVRGMSGQEPVRIPKNVLQELESVRRYTRAEVLDIPTIRHVAMETGKPALVVWIDKHEQEYGQGLLDGFRAAD